MARFYKGKRNIKKSKVYLFLSLGLTNTLNDLSQSKEIYRNLSSASKKSNNIILANRYKSKEKAIESNLNERQDKARETYWNLNQPQEYHQLKGIIDSKYPSKASLHLGFLDTEFSISLMSIGFGGLLVTTVFLYHEYRKKQLINNSLNQKNQEINKQNEVIKIQKEDIENQNTQLQLRNKELVSFDQEKNQLIGIVAHDLKSPLKQINGLMSIILIEKGNLSDSQLECMKLIMDSSKKASEMINKILDLDAIEANKTNIYFEKVNLSNIVENIVDSYKNYAQEKEITINFKKADIAYYANVDKEYITQVIENLLSNAIKFSPFKRSVYLNLSKSEGLVQFQVRDEGPGISEEDQTRLFGKFQKLSARPTAGESSTGLGLSIVKKYVDMMNGKVWCESQEGEGACFFIEFPAVS